MFSVLKKILGIRTTNHSRKPTEAPLFSGSAFFSNRVPKAFSEKWVANGGEISSGTTSDKRARYFFATDPSEPWVTKLFAKSVMVIHAGWIVHCVDEAFQVPIAEYILDERFVPEAPYKLINTFPPPIYVPLSEPGEPTDAMFDEFGPTPVQTSDTPSTPTSMPRKRKREQAYFDSPSGSLVFSGFDKDGMPRRPRKQRKLRFDPSFSPESGRSGRQVMQGPAFDWLRDHHNASRDDGEFSDEHAQGRGVGALRGCMTAVRSPDTPDKPLSNGGLSATCRHFSADEHLSKPTHVSSTTIFIDKQEKMPPVRTIDFTNLPTSIRRRRFLEVDGTKSRDTGTILSAMKPADHKVKTPKKISFANRARVCVYMVSPRRQGARDGVGVGLARQSLSEGFEDGPEVDGNTRQVSSNEVNGPDDLAAEATKNLAPRTDSDPKISGDSARSPDGNQPEDDTFTYEEVQTMRCHFLELLAKIDVDNGQLATLFELGKTYRGKTFGHVW